MRRIEFAKGHGTRNDFVLFVDPDAQIELSNAEVTALCDRRAGIGADGILRAVKSTQLPGHADAGARWFMDYRNADGSIAEMCGNGLRVFLRYLEQEALIDAQAPVTVATRAGLRTGTFLADGQIAVTMGPITRGDPAQVHLGQQSWVATSVDVGNPHAVVVLGSAASVADLDLSVAPTWDPATAFPNGVNVEFITIEAPGQVVMRVFERGVGETESCGTGVVAAASVAAPGTTCTVRVPGGQLAVDNSGAEAVLVGPAEIVARGTYYFD